MPIYWFTDPDDPGRLRDSEERIDPPLCDHCGGDILIGPVSLAGVGIFCSRGCATLASLKHAALMAKGA